MYSSLFKVTTENIYPGKVYRHCLQELENSQWFSPHQIEEIQLKKIQLLLKYAYENVPFYRKRFQHENIHPQDIRSVKDFQALPILTRDEVKNYHDELISTRYNGPVVKGKTSGSTGTPMHFVMERNAEWLTNAFNSRCRGWYGVKPGDKRAFITALPEDYLDWPWRRRLAANIKRHRFLNARTMTESTMQEFAELLIRWQPVMLRAYPSALAMFAHYLKAQNIRSITPKLVEVTGEKVTVDQRHLFEEVFNAPIADHYASLEIYSYAYQCPEGGLHVNEDRYLELVETGQAVIPGQMGEVVVTSLNQFVMPFIRYRNGDVAIYNLDICSCGRGLPVLREVVGRNCDLLAHSNGHAVHWSAVSVILRLREEVLQYQVYQPDHENLEIRLVCKKNIDTTFLKKIRNELQPIFGESMHITVKVLDHIELTAGGKHRYVISEVKPDVI